MKAVGPVTFTDKIPIAIPGVTILLQNGQTPPTPAQIQAQIAHINNLAKSNTSTNPSTNSAHQ